MNSMLPHVLKNLRLPVIGAPMFTVSYPELVAAQCKAGIVGSFPALNARPVALLDTWLTQLNEELVGYKKKHPERCVGPIAVNQIMHVSNKRLEQDVRVCVQHQVPIFITSLRAPIKEILDAVHSYGGIVLHDVISQRHAEKALEAGVDGLILVASGAGGHAGALSPFALVGEVRRFFAGPLVLAGAITTGQAVLAAQVMGADLAYVGTRFIATQEAHASEPYKQALVRAQASEIVYTDYFTGVHGNYVQESIVHAGLDPKNLSKPTTEAMSFVNAEQAEVAKTWKDIWGAGQGVGMITDIPSVKEVVDQMEKDYLASYQAWFQRMPAVSAAHKLLHDENKALCGARMS